MNPTAGVVRWTRTFIPTLREDPKDAEAISHKLMLRAGYIRRLGSGAYSYLPLGTRVLHNVIRIIREEMDRTGAQECLLPALQPLELWKQTGRAELMGDVLIRFKDRTGKDLALGPTHEEVITSLAAEIKSHKQLPVTLYQIQTKFRDEPRPRSGVIRSKEFIMKDAYSFDTSTQGLDANYDTMFAAYQRIFKRCGVSVLPCEADSGVMGGNVSHEFMAPADSGEDLVVTCAGCGYAANREAAKGKPADASTAEVEPLQPIRTVATPGQHTVEQVSAFLKVPASKLLKTMIYELGDTQVAVLVRGDHEVNEAKLARLLKTPHLRLAGAATIEKVTGAPVGFAGPVGLPCMVVADHAVMSVVNAVTGANQAEHHLMNVNPTRDFTPSLADDIRFVSEGDVCAKCGGALALVRTIESGHVFKLGTKYSQALGAIAQDAEGKSAPMIMGCYGIGVTRIPATAIEQHHDQKGIIWPVSIAPFQVVVTVLEAGTPELLAVGEQTAERLVKAGYDVLLDDRVQSPGSKLVDADLIGIPLQVVIGKAWKVESKLEVVVRASKEAQRVAPEGLVEVAGKLLDKLVGAE